jgi:hypothetical protein
MKLAVLGTDADVIQLLTAAGSLGHEIAWLGDVRPNDQETLRRLIFTAQDDAAHWELLLGGITDAVVVGCGTAPAGVREEQLKRLVAAAIPLLIVQPTGHSVLTYYELDMISRETGSVLRHYNPLIGHPAIREMCGWIDSGHPSVGPIQQVACEHQLRDSQRRLVTNRLTRDVELIAAVAGDIRQVSAVGPRDADASYASLQVQFATSRISSLRWAIRPPSDLDRAIELSLVGRDGTVTLMLPSDMVESEQNTWQLVTVVGGEREVQCLEHFDPARVAIQQLAEAVTEPDAAQRGAVSSWPAATQAMEVVDAVELSLQKGRTIPVHPQQLTEQLAFRGMMSAIGCGILMLAFVLLFVVGFFGDVLGQGFARRAWPFVLLALLAVFLLLQTVPWLATKKTAPKPQNSSDPNSTV